eukprot:jgi/Ulvmu1/12295/UM088_0011.1
MHALVGRQQEEERTVEAASTLPKARRHGVLTAWPRWRAMLCCGCAGVNVRTQAAELTAGSTRHTVANGVARHDPTEEHTSGWPSIWQASTGGSTDATSSTSWTWSAAAAGSTACAAAARGSIEVISQVGASTIRRMAVAAVSAASVGAPARRSANRADMASQWPAPRRAGDLTGDTAADEEAEVGADASCSSDSVDAMVGAVIADSASCMHVRCGSGVAVAAVLCGRRCHVARSTNRQSACTVYGAMMFVQRPSCKGSKWASGLGITSGAHDWGRQY